MRRMIIAVAAIAMVGAAGLAAAPDSSTAKETSISSKSAEAVEAFQKGREYLENVRPAEAAEQFKKAVELDPGFALAHAYLGQATPGAEGLKHLEQAASLAQGRPEAERTLIDLFLANRRGEEARATDLARKLATLSPGDWRAHFGLGARLSGERKWDEAIAALKRATELNPDAGSAYNTLGYTYLFMGKNEQAIEAFRKYAAVKPNEPNPQDSLAEALMAAGRFEEAEAAFRKAAEVSPRFHIAWEGVAQTRFLRGDWAGGRDALARARAAATRSDDRLETDLLLAYSHAAEGNAAEAMRIIDSMEKAAEAEGVGAYQAFSPLNRATLLLDAGKPDEALKQVAVALDKADTLRLPGSAMNDLRRNALVIRADAESKLGRPAEVNQTLALLEAEARKSPANAQAQSAIHFARGSEAMARGDARGATEHFSQCIDEDHYCRLQLLRAQEKAGDTAGAEATRRRMGAANRRGPLYLYVRSELKTPAK